MYYFHGKKVARTSTGILLVVWTGDRVDVAWQAPLHALATGRDQPRVSVSRTQVCKNSSRGCSAGTNRSFAAELMASQSASSNLRKRVLRLPRISRISKSGR